MTKRKVKHFKKVVNYYYPNGEVFEGNSIGYYLLSIIVFIFYVVLSPLHFFESDFVGKREVYWREIK